MEESDFRIRQIQGTEQKLRSLLSSIGVKEDTVYAYIYRPGSCPRCESNYKDYKDFIAKKGKKMLLITVFSDSTTAAFYNNKKGFEADYYLYDTQDKFRTIASFNTEGMVGSFIMKLSASGRMITGYDAMGFSNELAQALLNKSTPLETENAKFNVYNSSKDVLYPISSMVSSKLDKGFNDYKLTVSPTAPLCEIFRIPYIKDDTFFYPDELLGSVPVYKHKTASNEFVFDCELKPADQEKNMFINLDTATFNMIYSRGTVHYIVCNAWPLDNNHIGLSYSLPNIFFEAEDALAYYNKACILSRKNSDYAPDTYFVPDFQPEKTKFFDQHFQFSSTGEKLFFGCVKMTVPYYYDAEEYRDCVDVNPFKTEFYKMPTPFIVMYDRKTGKQEIRLGQLDQTAEKTRTGYSFVNPVSMVCGKELVYTDGCSGKIYTADTTNVAKETGCYTVFEIRDNDLPPVDTTKFYTEDYSTAYDKVFCRQIEDIRATADKIYGIIFYGNYTDAINKEKDYSFVEIDRKTGKKREFAFPKANDYTVFTRGLYEHEGKISPFEILKTKGEALIRVYKY